MKKIISCLLVSLLVLNGIIPGVNAYASTGEINYEYNLDYLEVLEEEILEEFEEELVQEYGFEILEDMEVDISISEEEFIVEIDFEEEDFIASLEIAMNIEDDDITLIYSEANAQGERIIQEFKVIVDEIDEEIFIATLIDLDTGETHRIDTSELNASALPVLIIAIGGKIIKTAIVKVGTKMALKIGGKTFFAAPAATVTNALKNFSAVSYRVGSHTFRLTQTDMRHILVRHHPSYWNGTIKSSQTFFHHNTTINQIRNIAIELAKQNRTIIASKGTTSTFQVHGMLNGVRYTMGITNGHIRQIYPR